MPTPSEIDAKIREIGIAAESMPREQARAEAVNAILTDRAPTPPPFGTLLSRTTVAVADGYLEITVTHHTSEGTAPA
ncbi:hypothetical protein [Nocardiopsis sp. NPDC058789]|uniref:hypothetical protein n=1 Tax=Nocardiopsis sp. NPDC058789 TaxID=3346634 RepID=UPI00366C2074